MRLATEEEVLKAIAALDSDGSRRNAGVALDVSYSAVTERLGTELAANSYTDFLSYETGRYQANFRPVEYRLTAGFIDSSSFVVRYSTDRSVLSDISGGEAMDSAWYSLDPDKGVFTLRYAVPVGFGAIAVGYDAGFDVDPDNQTLKGIPEWLKNGGIVAAAKLIEMNPAHFVARKALILKDVQSAFLGEVSQILNPHIRPRMGLVWPDRTVIEQ